MLAGRWWDERETVLSFSCLSVLPFCPFLGRTQPQESLIRWFLTNVYSLLLWKWLLYLHWLPGISTASFLVLFSHLTSYPSSAQRFLEECPTWLSSDTHPSVALKTVNQNWFPRDVFSPDRPLSSDIPSSLPSWFLHLYAPRHLKLNLSKAKLLTLFEPYAALGFFITVAAAFTHLMGLKVQSSWIPHLPGSCGQLR